MAQQVEQVLNSKPSFITTKHPSVDEQIIIIERVILTLEKWLDVYNENELEG